MRFLGLALLGVIGYGVMLSATAVLTLVLMPIILVGTILALSWRWRNADR